MSTGSTLGDRPLKGIILMVVGIGAFSTMDALVKWLTSDYSVVQIIALRSWFGLPVLFLIVHFEGGLKSLRTRRPLAHFGRYILVLGLSFSFFWALSRMKLVDAVAITFAAPILITALSVPLLGEHVGWRRWAAIGAGFVGVLVMLRPGTGVFQWAALVVLGSAVFYSLLMITTRALKSTENTASLIFYPQVGISLTGVIIAPMFWTAPTYPDLGLFAMAGIFGSVGILCLTHAFRLAPAAVVSPFEYTALIWATLLGFVLWGELPDTVTMSGALIVSLSGLYIIYRETARANRNRTRPRGTTKGDMG